MNKPTSDHIYFFPKGIVGLPEYQYYTLEEIEDGAYFVLEAVNKEVSFILLPAHIALQNYDFHIDQATIDTLEIEAAEEVATFVIVNMIDGQLYVNLKAPVLLSPGKRKGCQFIIDNAKYPLRHPLNRQGDDAC